jgi:putative alpha-1,2-mannosidase
VFDGQDNEVATIDMEVDDEHHTLENLTTYDTYLDLKPLASVLKKEKMNDEFDEKAPTSTDNEEKNKRKHITCQ